MTRLEQAASAEQKVEALSDEELRERAQRTWEGLQSLYLPNGLAADRIEFLPDGEKVSWQTKPTNIGLGLLAVLGAEQLGLVDQAEADARLATALKTVASLERHRGFFLDWYDARSAQRLAAWPANDKPLPRFLSAVDNAWLAASLLLAAEAKPSLKPAIEPLIREMDWSLFFDQEAQELWGGYNLDADKPTHWHYGRQFMSEARLVHYVAAALADPQLKKAILERLFNPEGQVPSATFGGSLFEQLAPTLLVDEPHFRSSHEAEIDRHRQQSHPDGWWGLSPCDDPNTGKYVEVGVGGYYQKSPIIAPYALFLSLKFAPQAASETLARLEENFPVYTAEGYRDSVDVDSGKVAPAQLFLDQSFILLALTNHLRANYFPKLMAKKLTPG